MLATCLICFLETEKCLGEIGKTVVGANDNWRSCLTLEWITMRSMYVSTSDCDVHEALLVLTPDEKGVGVGGEGMCMNGRGSSEGWLAAM